MSKPRTVKQSYSVVLIIIAVIIIASVSYLLYKLPSATVSDSNADATSQTDVDDQGNIIPGSRPPIPDEASLVASYAGIVSAHDVSAKAMTINTIRGEKIVRYTDNTEFTVIIEPKLNEILSDGDGSGLDDIRNEQTLSSPEEITSNSRIQALSPDNIRGANDFIASKITLIK